MKITRLRLLALAVVAAVISFVAPGKASALDVGISVGTPPPPVVVEHRWHRPYRGAVWIPGEYSWAGGRWVWVGGYWGYPPFPGAVWIGGHYRHGYYRPGHWSHA